MVLMFPLSGRVSDILPRNIDVNTGFFMMVGLAALTRIGLSWVMTPPNATSLRYVPSEKLANGPSNANFFHQSGAVWASLFRPRSWRREPASTPSASLRPRRWPTMLALRRSRL